MSINRDENASTTLSKIEKTLLIEDKSRICLSNVLDTVNNNNLNLFYSKDESLFKKRIDKLNLKFYIETEKYLTNKNDMEGCQDKLFMILFKQISLYIEEVERLNNMLRNKKEDEKSTREKLDELNKRCKDRTSSQMLIQSLRNAVANLEKKLGEKMKSEEKAKKENDSLKRQNKFYKEKLKIDIALKKLQEENKLRSSTSADYDPRSTSKDKNIKKININISNHNNLNINNEILITENHITSEGNKKRNFSDNNPTQGIQVNKSTVVTRRTNNRYGDNLHTLSVEKVANANTKHSMIKSPTNQIGQRINFSGPNNNLKKSIIKTIKQQGMKEQSKDKQRKETINYRYNILHTEDNALIKSPRNSLESFIQNNETISDVYLTNMQNFDSDMDYLTQLEDMLLNIRENLTNKEEKTYLNKKRSSDLGESKIFQTLNKNYVKTLQPLPLVTIDLSDKPVRTPIDSSKENKYKLK